MSAANFKLPEDIGTVKETVLAIDRVSQDGFGRIHGLAKLALLSLETPEGHRNTGGLVAALTTISMIAEDMENCINDWAGHVGCAYRDQGWERIAYARRAFQDSQREGVAA